MDAKGLVRNGFLFLRIGPAIAENHEPELGISGPGSRSVGAEDNPAAATQPVRESTPRSQVLEMRAIQSVSRHARNRDPPHDGRSCLSPRLKSETILYSPLPIDIVGLPHHLQAGRFPGGCVAPLQVGLDQKRIGGRDIRRRLHPIDRLRFGWFCTPPCQSKQTNHTEPSYTSHPASSSRVHLGDPPRKTRYKGQIVPRTTEDYYSKGRADGAVGRALQGSGGSEMPTGQASLDEFAVNDLFNKIERSVIVLI